MDESEHLASEITLQQISSLSDKIKFMIKFYFSLCVITKESTSEYLH